MNIGATFNKNADNRSIEVNILTFLKILPQEITLFFAGKIRNEQKFSGIERSPDSCKGWDGEKDFGFRIVAGICEKI